MVRAGYLSRAALLLFAVGIASPAWAEAPIDWYIDLKREAKYARIAADQGASVQDLRKFEVAANRLITRLDDWDQGKAPLGSKRPCLEAAQDFIGSLMKWNSLARHAAIVEGEPRRNACLRAIQAPR